MASARHTLNAILKLFTARQPVKKAIRWSSDSGLVPHRHELIEDGERGVVAHGPATSGPRHKHPVFKSQTHGLRLGPAGMTDPNDPQHRHAGGETGGWPGQPEDQEVSHN